MHKSIDVATPQAFKKNPSLVWEFYHYRREVAFSAKPNKVIKHLQFINVDHFILKCLFIGTFGVGPI